MLLFHLKLISVWFTGLMVGVAQSVERRIVIPVVVGSIPIVHPIILKACRFLQAFLVSTISGLYQYCALSSAG